MPTSIAPQRQAWKNDGQALRGRGERLSLAEQAYQLIRDGILRGNFPLGAIMSRRSLAEQLNMSFIPVAEALQRLENDGLIESRARAGTRVRVPTAEEIRGRFDVREALECQAARLCSERAKLGERLELRRSAENLDALFTRSASSDGDKDFAYAIQKYHLEFHMQVAYFSHSPVLHDAIEKSNVLVFNWLYDVALGWQGLPPRFHTILTEVIVSNDSARAEDAMREHVRHGLEGVLRSVQINSSGNWRVKRSG